MNKLKQLALASITLGRKAIIVGFSPSSISQGLAVPLQNATKDEQEVMLRRFIEAKHDELASIMIASALVASLVAALLSWQWFPIPAWTCKVAMLCALLHCLIGRGIACQQSIALNRVTIHPKSNDIIRQVLLGRSSSSPSATDVGFWVHTSWQIPTILLGNSIVFVVVGLAIAVYTAARESTSRGDESNTAICFSISLLFSAGCYFVSWLSIEWKLQQALLAAS
ncbi:hypothetical protein M409DRAFT_21193 [Zasmidium cellare ATCC 36951]|uniref:Uncharacterized protein n=1 Tax=Zasmidium cellare ATCC 36951 TaxID=1080233 RepID=A0A6A6CMS5_ZASCE|nr:uncharacterized protein M409DRAFT_21193 [Zasmidium cellare ATCC 36951]KAF2168444.1 hypothetical protein M409DRAFT_21193 [Zasmidium cellare ATCC 36951]